MDTKETSGSIIDIAKETVSTIAEKVIEVKEDMFGDEQSAILSEFREASMNKIHNSMTNISNSLGLLSKSGYNFKSMNVSLGIPPSLSTQFLYEREISNEEKEALLEEVKDNRIIEIILKCLFKANDFYHSVNIGSYKIDKVTITLGLTPGMSINFEKK